MVAAFVSRMQSKTNRRPLNWCRRESARRVYLICGRNLAVPIVAQGVQDTIDVLLIFVGKYPGGLIRAHPIIGLMSPLHSNFARSNATSRRDLTLQFKLI
jgi:hypothetical protein